MLNRNEHRLCAVILTALPVEYQAVRRHLIDLHEEVHPQGNVYEYGTFTAGDRTWKIVLVEAGAGNTGASRETERAITYFKPSIVFFVGVAGGVKDVQVGDVVAVTKAYGYESGKVQDTGFLVRPEVGMSSFRLAERARAEARKSTWLQRISGYVDGTSAKPRAFVGPIAAGEKVIASTNAELFKFLHTHYNDTLAVEMEGRGFLEAAHANESVQALIIRGISDLLANKSASDAQGSQELAADHASAFAFEVLAQLENETGREPERQREENLRPKEGVSKEFHTNIRGNVKIVGSGDNATYNYHEIHEPTDDKIRQQIDKERRKLFEDKKRPLKNSDKDKPHGSDEPKVSPGEERQATTALPVEIYFSFAKEDESLIKHLQNQLAFLLRQGLITDWSRDKVIPGQIINVEIAKHLNSAPIILLCISPDYLASDLCHQEMSVAIEREDAIVMPILLRRVAGLKDEPFAHFQCFPRNGRAISEQGSYKEAAFAKIAEEISAVVERFKKPA